MQNYTEYRYDGAGNLRFLYTGLTEPLTEQNEAQAAKTEYVYDHRGRVIDTIDPMGRHETATYDVNNNMIEKVDRNGKRMEYFYDGANRVTDIYGYSYEYGYQDAKYRYSTTGAVHWVMSENSNVHYEYDTFGRVTQEETHYDKKNYTYNLDDTRSSFTMVDNTVFDSATYGQTIISQTYDYDVLGRLSSVYASGEKIADYTYDANGNLRTKGSGDLSTVYTYNNANMLTSLTNKAKYNELSKFNYTYYLDGNQATKQDSLNGTTTYTYDGMGRLKSETALGYTDTYTYDNFGNRIAKNHVQDGITTTTAYTYDKNNRLLKEVESAEGTTAETDYYYDHNGNMLKKIKGFHTPVSNSSGMPEIALTEQTEEYVETYEYSPFGQLVKSTIDGVDTYYEYDANKDRRLKRTGESTTRFLTDAGTVVAETDQDNVVKNKYYHGFGLISSERNGITNYYLYDGHGNAIALADRNGAVTRNYQYDAFGNQLNADTNDTNPFRYCGEYWDAETGNIYLRARYYDPSIGRFISEDPIRDGLNWYVYCANNPVNFVDPSGTIVTSWDRKHLPADSLSLLEKATDAWVQANAIGDEYGMEMASTAARLLREPYLEAGETVRADGNVEKNGTMYHPYLWLGDNTIISNGETPMVDFHLQFGYGVERSIKAFGVGVELGGKVYYDATNMFSEVPTQSLEFGAMAKITNQIELGGTYTGTIDAATRKHLYNDGFVGIKVKDCVLGFDSIPDNEDIVLEFVVGRYIVVGGEAGLMFNVSEAYRRIGRIINK